MKVIGLNRKKRETMNNNQIELRKKKEEYGNLTTFTDH